jgi:predicted dehydrogenase
MARKRLRAGWIGAFHDAELYYLPSLSEFEDVELAALCHPEPDKLAAVAKLYKIEKTFSQPGMMLRQAELDLCFVTVPLETAVPVLEACIARKINVCTNLQTVLNVDTAKKLLTGAMDFGVKFNVLFPRRHIALLHELRGEIEKRGPLAYIVVTLHSPPSPAPPVERALANQLDWLAGIDLLRKLGGQVNSFSGVVGRFYDAPSPNALSAMIHFAGGSTGILLSDRVAGAWKETVEMHGRGLSAVLDLRGDGRIFSDDTHSVKVHAAGAGSHEIGGYKAAVRSYLDSLHDGRDGETNLVETIRTMELLRRIRGATAMPGEPAAPAVAPSEPAGGVG